MKSRGVERLKHIFVINPVAGKGKGKEAFRERILACCQQDNLDYEIHLTTGPYEAIDFVRRRAQELPGETLRFYACGGDGTIYEVVNGMWDAPNAEFAAIPLGSGNDFVRLFGGRELFLDVEKVIRGESILLDAIRCGDQIAVNQCSMGFDAEVCTRQAYYKRFPLVSGEISYILAVLECFTKKVGHQFHIEIDGKPIDNGTSLLCVCGNSRWYGGGFMAAPRAMPDDGMLDFVMVTKNGSRFKLLPLFMQLREGKHLDLPITRFVRGKTMTIRCDVPSAVNVDGETKYVREATFEILEQAIRFVLPQDSPFPQTRREWEEQERLLR